MADITDQDIDIAFKRFCGYEHQNHFSKWDISEEVLTIMQTLGLITLSGDYLRYSQLGLAVKKDGGWLKYNAPKDPNEKLDLMLAYFREKGNDSSGQYDPQNKKWGELALKLCGGNNNEFRLLLETLGEDRFLDTLTGSPIITPRGSTFKGYVETARIADEEARMKITYPKTPMRRIVFDFIAGIGALFGIVFGCLTYSDRTEINDLKKESKKDKTEIDSLRAELKYFLNQKNK